MKVEVDISYEMDLDIVEEYFTTFEDDKFALDTFTWGVISVIALTALMFFVREYMEWLTKLSWDNIYIFLRV